MKCPYCGAEMESGTIYGRQDLGIPWLPADKTPPKVWASNSARERNGLMLAPPIFFPITMAKLEMHVCRACGKGVCELPK